MHATCAPIACMPRCLRLVGVDVGAVDVDVVGAGKSPAIRSARGDEREKEQRSTASSLGASAFAISFASKQAEPVLLLLLAAFSAVFSAISGTPITRRLFCCVAAAFKQRANGHTPTSLSPNPLFVPNLSPLAHCLCYYWPLRP